MNEQQIRAVVRQEIDSAISSKRFGLNPIPRHTHNGVDSPPVRQENIVPNVRVLGDITMQTNGTVYNLGINFNPTSLLFLGVATGTGHHAMIVGNAQLGTTSIFKASTSTSVTTGGQTQSFIQGSTQFIYISTTATVNTSELYIASLASDTRLEVVGYTNTSVQVKCLLGSSWDQFVGTFIVT